MAGRAVATWTVELKPSEKTNYRLHAYADLKISNAALDPVLADTKGRSTVILHVDDDDLDAEDEEDEYESSPLKSDKPKRLVLTSLTPGKIESSIHDIIIARPANVTFEVIGTNTIHLSGYLFVPPGDDDEDDEEDMGFPMGLSDESSEYGITAGDVGDFDSDEVMDDAHRFEEIVDDEPPVEETNKSAKKRPRETDELDTADANAQHKQKKKAKKEKRDGASGETPLKTKEDKAKEAKKPTDVANNKEESKSKDSDGVKENGAKPPKASKKEEKGAKESQNSGEKPKSGKSMTFTELPDGLRFHDQVQGNGPTAKPGSTVKLRYIAKLLKVDKNGKVATDGDVFDSNTKGKPFTVKLGAGALIKGFDQGVTGMMEGGERVVYIPPLLGYGKKGSPPVVPPNANLRFEIKLLRVA